MCDLQIIIHVKMHSTYSDDILSKIKSFFLSSYVMLLISKAKTLKLTINHFHFDNHRKTK